MNTASSSEASTAGLVRLHGHLEEFAQELHCFLCRGPYKSPQTATQCGHIYCRECIQAHLRTVGNACPQCDVPVTGKSLVRNASYATMIQCVAKIQSILYNCEPATLEIDSQQDTDVLISVLGGVVDAEDDETDREGIVGDETDGEETNSIRSTTSINSTNSINSSNAIHSSNSVHSTNSIVAQIDNSFVKRSLEDAVVSTEASVPQVQRNGSEATHGDSVVTWSDLIDKRNLPPPPASAAAFKSQHRDKDAIGQHRRPVCLLLTKLSDGQRELLHANLKNLAAVFGQKRVEIAKDFSAATVTHIVCPCEPRGRCARTLKYMQGIAGKTWIVSFRWIFASLKAQQRLPEIDFVVTGDETVRCTTNACERSRSDPGRLFDNGTFLLAGPFDGPGPSKSELGDLIRLAGGTVVARQQEECIVVSNNRGGPRNNERSYTWLFDALSHYCVMD